MLVIRQAAVSQELAAGRPDRAVAIWPDHPDARIADGMARIGERARARRPVDRALVASMVETARRSPLAPEPFLVRGVELQTAGHEAEAGAAFVAARDRDPRNVAAHFFLADHDSRSGQAALALIELGRLARLVPGSSAAIAPRVAASIRQVGGPPAIRALVRDNPELGQGILQALATDARNADLIASLAPARTGSWTPALVASLVAAGQYGRAYALSAPAGPRPLLRDPRFRLDQPPPFGWALAEGAAGEAEPAGGGVHVVFYGRERLVAAAQILLLPAGRFSLSYTGATASAGASSLYWQLTCLPGETVLAAAPLRADGRPAAWPFAVPESCRAQRLELVGLPTDPPATIDAVVTHLDLRRMP